MAFNRSRGLTSQFMREQLNAVHSEPQEDYSALDQDLSLFTNTTFHDFDTGAQIDFKADDSPAPLKPSEPASATSMMGDYGDMDFLNTPAGGSWLPFYSRMHPMLLSHAPHDRVDTDVNFALLVSRRGVMLRAAVTFGSHPPHRTVKQLPRPGRGY